MAPPGRQHGFGWSKQSQTKPSPNRVSDGKIRLTILTLRRGTSRSGGGYFDGQHLEVSGSRQLHWVKGKKIKHRVTGMSDFRFSDEETNNGGKAQIWAVMDEKVGPPPYVQIKESLFFPRS